MLKLECSYRRSPDVDTTSNVATDDGFRAVYTGCFTLVLGTAFKGSVRFFSYNHFCNRFADDTGANFNKKRSTVAGTYASLAESVFAVTPIEP